MLNITEEQKKMFYTSGYYHNYVLTFPDIGLVIDIEKLYSETLEIKESICDEEEFTLGGCIASSMEFEVSEILADEIAGLEFTALLQVKDETDRVVQEIPMGIFRADKPVLVDDKDYKKVMAYDRLYDASVDVVEWFNDFFAGDTSHTIKETRESLLAWLGIPFEVQKLPNDGVSVEKTIDTATLTGTEVLYALCVINGGFGRMNRFGRFEVLGITGLGVFPEDGQGEAGNLYPLESLYPEDTFEYLGMSDGEVFYPEYRSTRYEEFMTMPITCLTIRSTSEDVGVTVGQDLSNPYVIASNFFLYGKSAAELQEIGQNILHQIEGLTYRPNTTVLDGLPYMEVGDVFILEKKRDCVESIIFSRTLSGIQALKDTYEAKGNKVRANEVTANDEILQLKGKTLEIKKSIDGVSVELKDFEKGTQSRFEQTDEKIETEVKEAEKELSSGIEQIARKIVLKVDSQGNLAEVALGVDADDPAATRVTVTAKNIELSAEEAINLLTGGTLNLTGKNITIESENFSVDNEGNAVAKSIKVIGGGIDMGDGVFSVDNEGNAVARSIKIDGGSINIKTSYGLDNEVVLQKLVLQAVNGSEQIMYPANIFGYGKPEDTGYDPGTFYLDLETGKLYTLYTSSQKGKYWDIFTQYSSTQWKVYGTEIIPDEGFLVKQIISGNFQGSQLPEVEEISKYGAGVSCIEDIETKGAVRAEREITAGGRITAKGDISAGGNLSVGGYKMVAGTTVIDYSQTGSAMSRQYLSTPGITNEMPAYVCNGDSSAQPTLLVSQTSICEEEESISFIAQGLTLSPARFSYFYWTKEE